MIPVRVAPVRPTPSWSAILRGAVAAVVPPEDPLAPVLQPWIGDRPILGCSSGRAALYSAIRLAMEVTGRSTVILPGYTSYSVAAAAARAQATIRLVDIDPTTLDFDQQALEAAADESVAAVVLGNLFGYPSTARLAAGLEERGIWLIDDAAQACGARADGAWVGTRGRAGVLSFGRGKCVTTGDGGALVLRTADDVQRVNAWLERPVGKGLRLLVMAAGLKAAAGPVLFGVVSRLPGLAVGESTFDPDFGIAQLPAVARGLAADLRERALALRASRTRVAERWAHGLRGIAWPGPPDSHGTEPAYLRWPLLAPHERARHESVVALSRVGLPFVTSYPLDLNSLKQLGGFLESGTRTRGAEQLARCLLALPCHRDVSRGRVRLAADALATVARSRNVDS